jgi:hypothetical protein
VISTGKADWEREVTDEKDSLAQLLRDQYAETSTAASTKPSFLNKLARKFSSSVNLASDTAPPPGVHPSLAQGSDPSTSTTLSILNSSFVSSSHHGHKESVMVFPDYKVVHDVEANKEDAGEMIERYLSSESGRSGQVKEGSSLKSWSVPVRYLPRSDRLLTSALLP